MTSPHLVTTPVGLTRCPRCRALIATGLAEGLIAHVDLTPLDQAAEVTALLAGLATYTLTTAMELVYRDASRISGGRLRGDVLSAHNCQAAADTDRPPF